MPDLRDPSPIAEEYDPDNPIVTISTEKRHGDGSHDDGDHGNWAKSRPASDANRFKRAKKDES